MPRSTGSCGWIVRKMRFVVDIPGSISYKGCFDGAALSGKGRAPREAPRAKGIFSDEALEGLDIRSDYDLQGYVASGEEPPNKSVASRKESLTLRASLLRYFVLIVDN
jgi:hypothetical protein